MLRAFSVVKLGDRYFFFLHLQTSMFSLNKKLLYSLNKQF